jgi:hypothetical protein
MDANDDVLFVSKARFRLRGSVSKKLPVETNKEV